MHNRTVGYILILVTCWKLYLLWFLFENRIVSRIYIIITYIYMQSTLMYQTIDDFCWPLLCFVNWNSYNWMLVGATVQVAIIAQYQYILYLWTFKSQNGWAHLYYHENPHKMNEMLKMLIQIGFPLCEKMSSFFSYVLLA